MTTSESARARPAEPADQSNGSPSRGRRSERRRAGRTSSGPVGIRPGAGGNRQRQLPWVALGVLLVVMSMLGFALWSVQQAARTPILVAGNDIDAGDTIDRADLVLVSVGADAGLEVLEGGQEGLLVDRVARGPIPAGTPLSTALVVAAAEAVPSGWAVVGSALAPGAYPSSALRAGDRVSLVRTGSSAAPLGSGDGDPSGIGELGEAVVWAVEPLPNAGRGELFISLLVREDRAPAVSNVASEARLRLILLGAES